MTIVIVYVYWAFADFNSTEFDHCTAFLLTIMSQIEGEL